MKADVDIKSLAAPGRARCGLDIGVVAKWGWKNPMNYD